MLKKYLMKMTFYEQLIGAGYCKSHLHAWVVVDVDGNARRCHVSAADGLNFGDATELRFIQQLIGEQSEGSKQGNNKAGHK